MAGSASVESLFVPLTFVRRSTCASHVFSTPTRPICGNAALSLSLPPPPSFASKQTATTLRQSSEVLFPHLDVYLSRHFECHPLPIWISLLTQREPIVDSCAHCRRRSYFLFSKTIAPPCYRRKRHEYGHGEQTFDLTFLSEQLSFQARRWFPALHVSIRRHLTKSSAFSWVAPT
jgi:hypothetical protein